MSRPPVPHPAASTGRDQSPDPAVLDYLPLEYGDLLALQDQLAVTALGRPVPGGAASSEEADTTRTFMELSALVAHILAVYQRRYASEAFIGTVLATSNMLRHARRLAFQPDAGLASTGYVILTAKDGVHGTVAAGLPLASVPLGDQSAQDYESLDDLLVDAALNDMEPLGATKPVRLDVGADRFRLKGLGHRIEPGDPVALVGPHWQGFVVKEATELPAEGATVVVVDRALTSAVEPTAAAAAADPTILLAHPTRTLRPFGSSADAALYPPQAIRNAGAAPSTLPSPASIPFHWYEVQTANGGGYVPEDVYLSTQEAEPLSDAIVLRRGGTAPAVLRVSQETVAAVSLHRQVLQVFNTFNVSVTTSSTGTFTSTLVPTTQSQPVRSHISGSVTTIRVANRDRTVLGRIEHPVPADWLTGWSTQAELAEQEPNAAALAEPLVLVGELAGLTPGRALAFVSRSKPAAEIVTIRRALVGDVPNQTHIWWDTTGIGGPPPGGWTLDDVQVHGNVARVSHGRTVHEALGGSDGVTAFQRFALKESPVTILTGAMGGEPALEVRVGDVRWTPVPDLAQSGPDDRHYRSETDDRGTTTVVFGDGINGAVPPSGKKNVTARYRVGLGPAADVAAGRLSRVKRAHPLLDRVINATPVLGGTAPASIDDTRSQATRFIRTFDRAVSVSDLADLALTIPGIARAAARWDQATGAVLVVATAGGDTPPALGTIRAFLDARRDVTVPLRLVGPQPHDLRVNVEIEADPAHLAEIVKATVRASLHGTAVAAPGMFTFPARGLGQPAYLSELYQRLDGEPGVVGVRVLAFSSLSLSGVADVIPAGVDEWLRLRSNDLTVTVVGERHE